MSNQWKRTYVWKHPSHALNSSRRKWNVNLQKATILVDGKPTTVKISARELRTLRKSAKNINSISILFLFCLNLY